MCDLLTEFKGVSQCFRVVFRDHGGRRGEHGNKNMVGMGFRDHGVKNIMILDDRLTT